MNTVVAIPLAGPLPGPARVGRAADGPARRSGFLAGSENRYAQVALESVLRSRPTFYSPLVLYGPPASGKTHLAVGLANWWREHRSGERVVLVTGRQFVDRSAPTGLEQQLAWRNECRAASLFVIDDLAPLAGRRVAQQSLCRTLDALDESGSLAIVTCRSLPSQMTGLSPALVGRLSAGLAAPISLPGAAARRAIVESLVAARRLPMTIEAAHLLADGIASSVPALAQSLGELEASFKADAGRGRDSVNGRGREHAAARGRDRRRDRGAERDSGGASLIDVAAVQSLLSQGGGCEPPTLRSIALQTAKYFRLTLADLKSPARRQALVLARGVAFVLIRELTDKSLDQIGVYFGGRDHTTVLHACRRTEKLAKRDAAVQQAMADLKRRLTLA